MSTGEELWIYHDTVSPLSYSSAPHGSCHTLIGQKNRLNMVRLAFLLTKLRGVWARCRWTPLHSTVCVHVCKYAFMRACSPPGDVEGNVIPNRTWCQLEVRASDVTEGFAVVLVLMECWMFLFTYRPYFPGVSCLKEFPLTTLCVAQKPQDVCVCVWLLVCLNV